MPPELKSVLLLAAMNPATLVVAYWLGRRADQRQKIVLAAFAAALAGTVYTWLLMRFGFIDARTRLLAGVFVASAPMGIVWAALGYWTRSHREGG